MDKKIRAFHIHRYLSGYEMPKKVKKVFVTYLSGAPLVYCPLPRNTSSSFSSEKKFVMTRIGSGTVPRGDLSHRQ